MPTWLGTQQNFTIFFNTMDGLGPVCEKLRMISVKVVGNKNKSLVQPDE